MRISDWSSDVCAADLPSIPRLEPLLEKLRDATNETAILGTRQGDRVIYLAVAQGPQPIRHMSRAGELTPIHASALGKSWLTPAPPDDRATLVKRRAHPPVTRNTRTGPTPFTSPTAP